MANTWPTGSQLIATRDVILSRTIDSQLLRVSQWRRDPAALGATIWRRPQVVPATNALTVRSPNTRVALPLAQEKLTDAKPNPRDYRNRECCRHAARINADPRRFHVDARMTLKCVVVHAHHTGGGSDRRHEVPLRSFGQAEPEPLPVSRRPSCRCRVRAERLQKRPCLAPAVWAPRRRVLVSRHVRCRLHPLSTSARLRPSRTLQFTGAFVRR